MCLSRQRMVDAKYRGEILDQDGRASGNTETNLLGALAGFSAGRFWKAANAYIEAFRTQMAWFGW
jgi:hypothetical protein